MPDWCLALFSGASSMTAETTFRWGVWWSCWCPRQLVPASTQPQTTCPRTWSAASTPGKHASCSSIAFFPCLLSFITTDLVKRQEHTFHCSWSDSTHTHQLQLIIFSDDNIHLLTHASTPHTYRMLPRTWNFVWRLLYNHAKWLPEVAVVFGRWYTGCLNGLFLAPSWQAALPQL